VTLWVTFVGFTPFESSSSFSSLTMHDIGTVLEIHFIILLISLSTSSRATGFATTGCIIPERSVVNPENVIITLATGAYIIQSFSTCRLVAMTSNLLYGPHPS